MNLDEIKPASSDNDAASPGLIRLKDFRPKSVFNVPVSDIPKARFPVIDMHTHSWQPDTDIGKWVKKMDEAGVEKSVILSFETGAAFDAVLGRFAGYKERFDVWCGFDYTGYDLPGTAWIERAVAELERCARMGAKGVGELGDKGLGEFYSRPVAAYGMHLDDSRMQPLWQKCGELHMPVSIHIADPIWMYLPMDASNDGLMNAYTWRIDMDKPGILDHGQLLRSFEKIVSGNPDTIFIACHFANCTHDLEAVGKMLERYPNLYTDITSRLEEIAAVPRYARAFCEKFQDRILYGTDLGYDPVMTMEYAARLYKSTFRLLESADEHFYDHDLYSYHWSLHGLALEDAVLRKIYRENALKIIA